MRAAIVGAGKIAGRYSVPIKNEGISTHAQALHEVNIQLAAVCDLDPSAANDFASRWKVPIAVSTVKELLALPRFDIVSVCTPDRTHLSVASEILSSPQAPRLLIMEKPVCIAACELETLESLLKNSSADLWVNHSRRFDSRFIALAELIRSGKLGRPVYVRGTYYGGWLHNGIHLVDTLRMLVSPDLRITEVRAGVIDREGDPCLDLRLTTDLIPGCAIDIESFSEAYYQLFEMEIRLELGRARIVDFGNQIEIENVRINSIGERELVLDKALNRSPQDSAMLHLYENARAALSSGKKSEVGCDFDEVRRSMGVLFEAQRRLK